MIAPDDPAWAELLRSLLRQPRPSGEGGDLENGLLVLHQAPDAVARVQGSWFSHEVWELLVEWTDEYRRERVWV